MSQGATDSFNPAQAAPHCVPVPKFWDPESTSVLRPEGTVPHNMRSVRKWREGRSCNSQVLKQ